MLMSSFSHNDLTSMGKDKRMPVHTLEHTISGVYPFVAHAAGLALIYPKWARYYAKYDYEKFSRLGEVFFGKYGGNAQENGLNAIGIDVIGTDEIGSLFKEKNCSLNFAPF